MKSSARARQQLPVLSEFLGQLAYVATKLPEAAAREMVLAVQYDWRRAVDPYGNAWAPVGGRGRKQLGTQDAQGRWRNKQGRFVTLSADGMYRRYDYQRHVSDSYYPVVSGTDAIIESQHRGSAALQKAYKRRPARRSHPVDGEGLGTWQKRIERMNRRLLVGARIGEAKRAELKADAAARRAARFEARNAARIRAGLKPLKPRAVRRDRARIDRLVRRAVG